MAQGRSNRGRKAGNAVRRKVQGAKHSTVCPFCSGKILDSARFCHHCGKSLDGSGWLTSQTLTVLAAAVISLVALGLLFASVIDVAPITSNSPENSAAPTATVSDQPPDLSTMTPREAADRLFNRVMMADEQGNTAEVEQFAPMAVAAYEMLESLDTDALFHMGQIHAAAGDIEAARSYADRMKSVVPNHLLAALLEHRLAEAESNSAAAASAKKQFHDHYNEEISISRPEYDHHRASIERFRTEHP